MPLPQVHRFPIDWTDPRACSDLLASEGVRPHLLNKEPGAITTIQSQTTDPVYPANALYCARQHIFQLGEIFTVAP